MPNAENDALRRALETILARVRCEAIHDQTNNGRCVSCISWAKHVGAPRHLPRLEQAIDPCPIPPGVQDNLLREQDAIRLERWSAEDA